MLAHGGLDGRVQLNQGRAQPPHLHSWAVLWSSEPFLARAGAVKKEAAPALAKKKRTEQNFKQSCQKKLIFPF